MSSQYPFAVQGPAAQSAWPEEAVSQDGRAAVAGGSGTRSVSDRLAQPDPPPPNDLVPTPSLPKGGGALSGLGEKFAANAFTGTGSFSVPITTSPGRGGGLQLTLNYDSGAGNGAFGIGWQLSLPSIARKTDRGLPRYLDEQESDTFILAGVEDLVPTLEAGEPVIFEHDGHRVCRYRPRIEAEFARIERWLHLATREMHWRVTDSSNTTSFFGLTAASRAASPTLTIRIASSAGCSARCATIAVTSRAMTIKPKTWQAW